MTYTVHSSLGKVAGVILWLLELLDRTSLMLQYDQVDVMQIFDDSLNLISILLR